MKILFRILILGTIIYTGAVLLLSDSIEQYGAKRAFKIELGKIQGSGSLVQTKKGNVILTVRHLCEDFKKAKITNRFLKIEKQVKILKISDKTDLCLIEGIKNIPGYVLSNLHPEPMDRLIMFGFPSGRDLVVSEGRYVGIRLVQLPSTIVDNVCKGSLSIVMTFFGPEKICLESYRSYNSTLYTQPGSSGSGVLNYSRHLIGVTFALTGSDGFNSSIIPIDEVKQFIEEYEKE